MRFVLVHGMWHGAWCWDRVIPELRARGHEAIAIDLPGHGARVAERPTGLAARSQCVTDALRDGDVLVGHSAGGYDITIAADRAPDKVVHLIYLAAGVPLEGRKAGESMMGVDDRDPDTGEPIPMTRDPEVYRHVGQDAEGRSIWLDREGPRRLFYHDCDDATVDWAFARLTPGVDLFPDEVLATPRFHAAARPRSYILCTEDRTVSPIRARLAARRLGVEPIEIAASHSPFLSRPAELVDLMVRAAG
jgi:pimeloyl-ACP methyl ester carboxylesterase